MMKASDDEEACACGPDGLLRPLSLSPSPSPPLTLSRPLFHSLFRQCKFVVKFVIKYLTLIRICTYGLCCKRRVRRANRKVTVIEV